MKNRIVPILMFLFTQIFVLGKVQSGLFFSVKNFESAVTFDESGVSVVRNDKNFDDFFLKLVNISPGKIEFNIAMDILKVKELKIGDTIIGFTQLGLGAELGKVVNLTNLRIFGRPGFVEMVYGISGMIFFNRKYKEPEMEDENSDIKIEKILYRFGFYSAFRFEIELNKMHLYSGIQINYPFKSNEIPGSDSTKQMNSYIFFGVAF